MSTTYVTLCQNAQDAINARDAIDNCSSPAWKDAHRKAREACQAADAERNRLAKNPATRYGSWRRPSDKILMTFGYL